MAERSLLSEVNRAVVGAELVVGKESVHANEAYIEFADINENTAPINLACATHAKELKAEFTAATPDADMEKCLHNHGGLK